MTIEKKSLENTVEKEENPFPTIFSTLSNVEITFEAMFNLPSANPFIAVQSKIVLFDKDLIWKNHS